MAQISKLTILPTTVPASPAFVACDTANISTAVLNLRKVASSVELWPLLSVKKTIDLPTADYELEMELDGDTFDAGATNAANWTFDAGTTNLTIASIAKDSDTQCTFTFNTQAEWAQLECSGVTVAELNPVMTVDLTDDTFLSEVAAENLANWTITVGDTALTVASVTYVDGNQVTIEFTGTAAAGTITVLAEAAALTGNVNSGVASYDVATEVSTCTDAPRLVAGNIVLTAKAAALTGVIPSGVCAIDLSDGSYICTEEPEIFFSDKVDIGAANPTITLTLNFDAFLSKAAAENVDNWVIGVGATGLVLDEISWVSDRVVDISFTGTVAAGTIAFDVLPAALIGARVGVSTSYIIGSAAWTNPGTWTQEALEGTVEVYQYLPGDDMPAFVYEYGCPTGTTDKANVNLFVAGSAFNPRFRTSLVYDFGNSEETTQTIYGKLVYDL